MSIRSLYRSLEQAEFARLIMLATATLAASSCSMKVKSDGAELTKDALLAEAGGPGGCTTLTRVDTLPAIIHFPQVTLVQGMCLLEHGDTAVASVGLDNSGTLFLLDSPSAFRFLLRRHPVVGVDSQSLVDYARVGLIFSGQLRMDARLIRNQAEASDSDLATAGRNRDSTLSSNVQHLPHGLRIVWVTTFSGGRFATFGVTVDDNSGEITVVQRPGNQSALGQ